MSKSEKVDLKGLTQKVNDLIIANIPLLLIIFRQLFNASIISRHQLCYYSCQ